MRSLRRRFKEAGLEFNGIDAVLITHGHSDHVYGVDQVMRHTDAIIYCNEGTRNEVPALRGIDRWKSFDSRKSFTVGDIKVRAFETPHDAAEPVGFRFECEGVSGMLATDLGEITDSVAEQAMGCDWLVLEANHDEELLKIGPYPWSLKRRVLGSRGHLSNRALAEFLGQTFDQVASHLFLAHLSRQNNDPDLALESAKRAANDALPPLLTSSLSIHLTHQYKPSIVVDL
jgi:phosphoribosyl 1,2-cyclic phosphodiesterase